VCRQASWSFRQADNVYLLLFITAGLTSFGHHLRTIHVRIFNG